MSVLFNSMLLGAGDAPIVPSISYIGAQTGTTVATQTLSSVAAGSADANRLVIVAIFGWSSSSITGLTAVTINGVSATLLQSNSTTGGQTGASGIAYAMVPTGTTVNVGLTFSATLGQAVEVAVWRAIVSSGIPVDTDDTNGGTTVSLTLSGGSVGVFQSSGGATGTLSSSVNLTQDIRLASAISRPSYVGRIDAPGSLFSTTMNNSNTRRMIGASWS